MKTSSETLIIVFQDGTKYELDLNKSLEEKIDIVNNIINDNLATINTSWENNKTKNILNALSNYIYNGDGVNSSQEYSILSDRQVIARNGEIEIPVDYSDSSSYNFINKFKEKFKKKGRKAIIKYENSITHKLNILKINPSKRINRKIPLENTITTHCFKVNNGQIEYSNDMKYYSIDVFTPEDINLPFINPSLPYLFSWAIVNWNNEFIFNGKKYKINDNGYSFDKVLCYYQEKNYFLDPNINLINELVTTIYN